MRLHSLEINGFKSFSKKTNLEFQNPIVSIVGPNGSGKSNVVEAFRFVLGEQSMKSMRGKMGLDMIFKGSKQLPKGNRASVTIYFNNSDKVFKLSNEVGEEVNLNFDTVSISREVYPDGINKYILNGSEVRLKDINNLLSSVNIGSSGHHIISQGEADRVLNANPKELREIVEDALGLKVYQYKIKETERKLERSEENMKEVTMLRRENAPHLNFLRKQVEKFEKAKEMKVELLALYREYLKKESIYLNKEDAELTTEKNKISRELKEVEKEISEDGDGTSKKENAHMAELKILEHKLSGLRTAKSEIERKLGRIEGMLEIEESKREEKAEVLEISREEVDSIVEEVNQSLDEAILREHINEIKPILERIKNILRKFSKDESSASDNRANIENLKKTQREVLAEMKNLEAEEGNFAHSIEKLKADIQKDAESMRDREREKFTFKVRRQELTSALELILLKENNLKKDKEAFELELREGSLLVGSQILSYKEYEFEGKVEKNLQEEERRKIERIKLRLEDAGLSGGEEINKEFNQSLERDQFLAKEMEDLAKSIESLKELTLDLKSKIDEEFRQGVKKINNEFNEFFKIMFGGGEASLYVVLPEKKKAKFSEAESPDASLEAFREENEEIREGVEIDVSLPHKKVRDLHALSGGERSLTSIALLFAMSQVNPPPFLILDETDAALDESNSRKFGDMVEKLSKHSQLIVVTHNRETMSHAGVLYGVTIGADGASKLLSVKFEEAAQIAK